MKDLQIFENDYFGSVRTLKIKEKPYFVGKDIANILGYRNGSRDIERHVDEEDRTITLVFDGTQYRNTVCINESGLYSLILSSKLPKAKEFKRWVTSEILPSIRKTGSYGAIDIQQIVSCTVAETIKQLIPLLQQNISNIHFDNGFEAEEVVIRTRTRKKSPGIIEKLPDDLRTVVDDMICSNRYTYQDVVELLAGEGIRITTTSVYRYAKRYF